jgi:hypothetical protein
MPSALGEFIEEEDTIVGQRHLARHVHLAAADQARDGGLFFFSCPGGIS